MEEFDFGSSTAMGILTLKSGFADMKNDTLEISDQSFRRAYATALKLKTISKLVGEGFHESHFALGFCDMLTVDGFDFDAFVKRLKKSNTKLREELANGASRKGFKLAILRAYNHGLAEQNKVSYPEYG